MTKLVKLYEYQYKLVDSAMSHFESSNKPFVLAAAPNAGKTEMAINIISRLLLNKPNAKILVLAHGTTILRKQFADRLKANLDNNIYQEIESHTQIDDTKSVVIAIPHAFRTLKKTLKFDLLIVDEAHEFYFADTYGRDLRDKLKPKSQLLLTGTPFKFTKKNNKAKDANEAEPFHMEMVTMNEMIGKNPDKFSSLRVLVCQSCYDFRETDFNNQGDLIEKYNFAELDTKNTVQKVLDALLFNTLNITPKPIGQLEKTLFACHSIKQASIVYQHLTSIGVKTRISVSEQEDIEGVFKDIECGIEEIIKFKEQGSDTQALVVVNRAILGYDHPELVNVVDISGTRNLSRMYQLMCRAVRAFPNINQKDKEKLFIKIGPHGQGGHEYTLHLMTALLQLNERTWFEKFDGDNFLHLPLPILPRPKKQRKPSGRPGPKNPTKVKMYLDVIGSDKLFEGMKDNLLSNPVAKVGTNTLGKIREILLGVANTRHIKEITEEDILYMIKTGKIPERIYE